MPGALQWSRANLEAAEPYIRSKVFPNIPEMYRKTWKNRNHFQKKYALSYQTDEAGAEYLIDAKRRRVVAKEDIPALLEKLWRDPAEGALRGPRQFYIWLRERYAGIARQDVEEWLRGVTSQQIHKQPEPAKTLRPILAKAPRERYQVDLIDVQKTASRNAGVSFLLTVLDIFTKFAWVKPLKSKEAPEVAAALRGVVEEAPPRIVQSDNGPEFRSAEMSRMLSGLGIRQIFSLPYRPQSQGAVERFNQTLKRKIAKFQTEWDRATYVDALEDLVRAYNTSRHTSTGKTPEEAAAGDAGAVAEVGARLKKRADESMQRGATVFREPYAVGTRVRVALRTVDAIRREMESLGRKSALPQWSHEVFTIASVSKPKASEAAVGLNLEQYRIRDPAGSVVPRVYRRVDLQPVGAKPVEPIGAADARQFGDRFHNLEAQNRRRAAQKKADRAAAAAAGDLSDSSSSSDSSPRPEPRPRRAAADRALARILGDGLRR